VARLSRRSIVVAGILMATVACVVAPLGLSGIQQRYAISMDPQWQSCLPWSTFFVRYGKPRSIHAGELVLFRDKKLDPTGFGNLPAIKYVAGGPGTVMEIRKDGVWIDGKFWGRMWLLPWMRMIHVGSLPYGRYVVPPGKVLLMGTTPGSFDGRYWGFASVHRIYGEAWPF